jgi:hypothetical protein
VSCNNSPPKGAHQEEGVSLSEGLARLRVRFLGGVRVLVGLGGRTTCVECLFQFSRQDLGDLVGYGSFFPLGQKLES